MNDLEDADDVLHPFDLPKVGGVHDDAFTIGGDHFAEGVDRFLMKTLSVNEVMNDLDLLLDGEGAIGFVAEILGYRGDGVALIDGEGHHWCKGLVFAYEGDIGSVQGRDDGNIAAGLGLDDLLGQVGGRSVGDGVVHVKQIELVVIDHVDHGAGQGGLVGRVVEEGIGCHADLVIEDVGVELIQPDGLLIRDKVHLVAFVGECLSQFCC